MFSKLPQSSFTALSPVLNQWFVCLFDEIYLCLDSEQCDCRELTVFCSSAWAGTWHAQTSDMLIGDKWMNWCWSWNSNTLATWCEKLTHLKRPWCWKRLRAGGEGDRGWDGWMASLTQWTWVWVDSGRWWWTGRPGVLQFMGSQRVGHDWVTELNESLPNVLEAKKENSRKRGWLIEPYAPKRVRAGKSLGDTVLLVAWERAWPDAGGGKVFTAEWAVGVGAKEKLGSLIRDRHGWRWEDLFFSFKDKWVLRLLEKENSQCGKRFQNDHLT